jgi:hypothetical protein
VRRTLVDDAQEAALLRDGHVKVRVLDDDALADLGAAFDALRPADGFDPPGGTPTNPTTYHCTFLDTDRDYKVAFDALVRRVFDPVVAALFADHVLLTANAYVKQPGRGQFEVHQNWTLTTEPSDLTVTVWVPLHDTDGTNGSLALVPGSHKLTEDVAFPRGDHYFTDYQDVLGTEDFRPVPVAAGEAVLFDDSIIHGSGANTSSVARRALQIAVIPAAATPVVWYPRDDGGFELLSAPGRFYLDTTLAEIDEWPDRFASVGTAPNPNRRLPQDEFRRRLASGPAVRRELWGW